MSQTYQTRQTPRQRQIQQGTNPWATQTGQELYSGVQPGQQIGGTLEEALTGDMRLALHDFIQAANMCEWCADQCLDEGPQMAECSRLCRDVAELAILNAEFITRDSVFGPDVAETFANAAEVCATECAQHPIDHCQECARTLYQAIDSTRNLLNSLGPRQEPNVRF